MDLAIRYTWLVAATLTLTALSIAILFSRRYFSSVYRYNNTILHLLGVTENHPKMTRWIIMWFVNGGIATLILSLLVNVIDTFLILIGQTGISFDPIIFPIAIILICGSLFLLIAATIPVLATPPSCPTALAIMTALHIYGFHYVIGLPIGLYDALALGSTFLYFLFTAIGVIGTFVSVYVLIRYCVLAKLHLLKTTN
jgi:hypothetical protein